MVTAGYGSGRWYRYNSKSTNDNFHRFSVVRLKELGVLGEPKRASGIWQWTCDDKVISSICYEVRTLYEESPHIRVYYCNKSSGKDYNYKIYFTITKPHYGGVRWWFRCPAANCGRRVGVLYLGNIFACRQCLNMVYSSQRKPFHDRMNDKAYKLAWKLGLHGDIFDGFWGKKPKGMHRKTFKRQRAEINYASKISMSVFAGQHEHWS